MQIEEKHIEELKNIANSASDGNWFPAAIVSLFFLIIVTMAVIIYKMREKRNNERHEESNQRHKDNEELIEKLTANQISMGLILARLEVKIENK